LARRASISPERGLVGGGLDDVDVGEHGGAELDPGAVARLLQRVGRMQLRLGRFLEVFDGHRALEQHLLADLQQGHLAEGRDRHEPGGPVSEVDGLAAEPDALLGQHDGGALDIGAEIEGDEGELGHGGLRVREAHASAGLTPHASSRGG
jgi:hypothetical protein